MRGRIVALTSSVAGALLLAGCSVTTLPTYDTVQSETTAVMQRVVDALPSESRTEDLTKSAPFACDDGEGVFFTGHWAVIPPEGFDTATFIDGLLDRLGTGFEPYTLSSQTDPGTVRFISTETHTVTTVRAVDADGTSAIDILSLSRCAQDPGDGQNEN